MIVYDNWSSGAKLTKDNYLGRFAIKRFCSSAELASEIIPVCLGIWYGSVFVCAVADVALLHGYITH